ncbi:hypothetical protein EG68_04597 [Paragonimus skrjabini miyazakii]|uniref:Uncharacterized protein n=1 Tax=Paragonimus skrjabini miyazakii TaxID=59628 RepID=A0A8S9Z2K0_9TREM|nr:hypothetical protein EG68_04597 [Paragonimus skrjabini miyazakii]
MIPWKQWATVHLLGDWQIRVASRGLRFGGWFEVEVSATMISATYLAVLSFGITCERGDIIGCWDEELERLLSYWHVKLLEFTELVVNTVQQPSAHTRPSF